MNSQLDVVLPDTSSKTGSQIHNSFEDELIRLNNIFNLYDECSELSLLNQSAFANETLVSEDLSIVVHRALEGCRNTNGFFNPMLGKVFKSKKSDKEIPIELRNLPSLGEVFISSGNKVKYLNPSILLDFGGIAKGYTLEKLKEILILNKVKNAFLSFGGSSIMAIGNHPHGKGWKTGIYNPFNPNELSAECILQDECLTVSGNTNQSGHIVNPFSLQSNKQISTIAVTTEDAVTGEMLSTALFACEMIDRHEIIFKNKNIKAIGIVYIENEPFVDWQYNWI